MIARAVAVILFGIACPLVASLVACTATPDLPMCVSPGSCPPDDAGPDATDAHAKTD